MHIINQKIFYHKVLGLQIVQEHSNCIRFKVGVSELIFKESNKANPMHFACNIPFESIISAKNWLCDRVVLLTYMKKDIIDFVNWKAKALYFNDPDGNIIEFIGRERIDIKPKSRSFMPRNSGTNLSSYSVPVSLKPS